MLANDFDFRGLPLTAILIGNPSNGTLTFNSDGSFVYTPNAGFTGTDTFTYQASNGVSRSLVATVTITVNATNQPPVANDDSYTTDVDTPLTVSAPGVLANDTDPNGDPLTAQLVDGPANGTLVGFTVFSQNESSLIHHLSDRSFHLTLQGLMLTPDID